MVINSETNIGVIHNFLMNVKGYSNDILLQLQNMVTDFLEDLFEMKGAFVVTNGLDETQIYSKSIFDFSKIKEIADLIATFDHNKFFKSISGPGFTQIDYITYDNYQIYFARVTSNHAIFILFADSQGSFDEIVNTVSKNLRTEMAKLTKNSLLIPTPPVKKEDIPVIKAEPKEEMSSKVSSDLNVPAPTFEI